MTLYTSDIETKRRSALKTVITYVTITIFCALFGAIYELFSHEVYSYFMIYAFATPLIIGALPYLCLAISKKNIYPNSISRNLHHSGVATLTVGSILKGVLDIYGTTNHLCIYYFIIGILFIIVSFILFLYGIKTNRNIA